MYVSRLTFHTQPGKTQLVEHELQQLMAMVNEVGGLRPRVLRNHFASLGAPDVVFEQEAPDLETLETQIKQGAENVKCGYGRVVKYRRMHGLPPYTRNACGYQFTKNTAHDY